MAQSLNVSSLVSKPVSLVSAGDNQVAICEPIVYLQATVDGDLSRHYTEWEQISGVPMVSLITVDAVSSYYTVLGLPGTDKVFRFWVDRGTPFAQYKDITVRTTPVSDVSPFEVGELVTINGAPDYAKVPYARFIGLTPFDTGTPGEPTGTYEQTTGIWQIPDVALFYQTRDADMDIYAARYAGVVVESWSGSTWNTVTVVSPQQSALVSLSLPVRLRVGAIYRKTANENQVVYSDWRDISGGYVCCHEPVKTFEVGELGAVSAVSRIVYILQSLNYDENVNTFEVGELLCNSTPVRIIWQVDVQNYSEDVSTFEVGELTTLFTVTRIAGGNLGG